MKTLHQFWFTFVEPPNFSPLNFGCGVTAYNYDDALKILKERVFGGVIMPVIKSVIVDVDIQTLESNHVIPNIGFVICRGVWFPQGY